jgi:hypothetical protein
LTTDSGVIFKRFHLEAREPNHPRNAFLASGVGLGNFTPFEMYLFIGILFSYKYFK